MAELLNAVAVAGKSALGFQAVFFALLAIGLNIHFGYAGLLNFGQAGFMAVGAYGLAVSVVTFDIGFWPAVGISLLGVLASASALRTRLVRT